MKPLSQHAPLAIVGVDASDHSDPAVVAAFRLAPALKLSVELLHAAAVGHDFWAHLDPLGVQRARDVARQRQDLEPAPVQVERAQHAAHPSRLADLHPHRAARVRDHVARGVAEVQRRAPLVGPEHDQRGVLLPGALDQRARGLAGHDRERAREIGADDARPGEHPVQALDRGVARALGAELTALHCFVRPELGFLLGYPVQFPASVVDTARETAEREFRRLLEPFDWRGVLHRQRFVEGEPQSELADSQADCDLIVIGTHGRSGVARALLGSVASSLLRIAKVPVLVTRTGA